MIGGEGGRAGRPGIAGGGGGLGAGGGLGSWTGPSTGMECISMPWSLLSKYPRMRSIP